MMNLCHGSIGFCGHNRAGFYAGPRAFPILPNTGHSHWLSIRSGDTIGNWWAPGFAAPFIKAVCRYQTSSKPTGFSKSRFFGNRLRSCIDQQRTICHRLVPMRHKPPTHRFKMTRALSRCHRVNIDSRTDIIIRHDGQIIGHCGVKQSRHRLGRLCYRHTPAHRVQYRCFIIN